MARTVEVTVAIHVDNPKRLAIRVSDTGDEASAHWIPRSLIEAITPLGKTTRGTDSHGQMVDLPMAEIEMPEWKAQELGLI